MIVVNGEPKADKSGNSAAEDILSNPDYASLKAVQDNKVYGTPNAPFSWVDRPAGPQSSDWYALALRSGLSRNTSNVMLMKKYVSFLIFSIMLIYLMNSWKMFLKELYKCQAETWNKTIQ